MTIRPDDEELTIVTGGRRLGGWLDFTAERGVERAASSLVARLTEGFPGQAEQSVVEPGASCEAYLGTTKVLTGYIDRYGPHVDAGEHVVSLVARSKTEDLVDCSVDIANLGGPGIAAWELKAATVGEAAKKICAPYGIEVTGDGAAAPVPAQFTFIVQVGMTCWQLLEEFARAAQVLLWDDEFGRLNLTHIGTKRSSTALVEGVNFEVGDALFSMDQRFSEYHIYFSGPARGTDGHITGIADAFDKGVPRKRVKSFAFDAVGQDLNLWAKQRVQWESSRRYGRSRQVLGTVTGWRDGAGALWTPNTFVHVTSPSLKVDEDWLIVEAHWLRGQHGTLTQLQLMPPDAVRPQPFAPLAPIPNN